MKKNNILVRYAINTLIAGVFFAPIVIYNYYTGGHILNEDDIIAFFMLGWFLGWMLKAMVGAGVSTSKDAIEAVDELKNGSKGE